MTNDVADQPSADQWAFIEQLRSPLHTPIKWARTASMGDEIDLRNGVSCLFQFPDPKGRLGTAYDDFAGFLAAGNIPSNGPYRIVTAHADTGGAEAYSIEARQDQCFLRARDTEGIRRALVALEDRIRRVGGPFISPGVLHRKPFIRTRISRCFFSPTGRGQCDELLDNVNYYPDEYLNRLAHEGVNALWLSATFKDLCPSRFFPEHGKDSDRRLAKLSATVERCLRYGIRIYLFCNEPMAFSDHHGRVCLPMASLERNPWFAGHRTREVTYFCTSSAEGREYIEACTRHIFSMIPDLGGMISINMGEFPTNCYSYLPEKVTCSRCSGKAPWEVYREMLSAFARGMKQAAPDAEFIPWLYTPALSGPPLSGAASVLNLAMAPEAKNQDILREIAAHAPKDVTLQLNFESNGRVRQLGREFIAYDYWLSWPGPSNIFADVARRTVAAGARAAAKIQVGCSHENATIPFLPVPGSLYRKYRAMQELGVSTVMQCWYFGNYPGVMNKAAGELSFQPVDDTEDAFLERLAKLDWPGHHRQVAGAWKQFMKGYENCPMSLNFAWFGPLHNSIVWPLHLVPVDRPITPSWTIDRYDSGDRIGECIGFTHSLEEVLTLLGRMDEHWQDGLRAFMSIEKEYAGVPARELDISLAKAIGLQIRSAGNVFAFYDLREKLPFMRQQDQAAALPRMEALVREEIRNSETMKALCVKDTRLGYHSEAEGYKFHPARLERRVSGLHKLLADAFPAVRADIEQGRDLFPEYTGKRLRGPSYRYGNGQDNAEVARFADGDACWQAWRDDKAFHFLADWVPRNRDDLITINIEPRRLWPVRTIYLSPQGVEVFTQDDAWWGSSVMTVERCRSTVAVPFAAIPWFRESRPLRVNVYQVDTAHRYLTGWIPLSAPAESRLLFGSHNSADLGWFLPGGHSVHTYGASALEE